MKRLLLLILASLIVLSACSPKKTYLSPLELEEEKEQVKKVIEDYHRASEDKNFGKVVETLADEVIFFGTDSSEVIKTFADFKKAIEKQWQDYDKIDYGELRDVSIQMDEGATLATIIYGVNSDFIRGEETYNYYLRIARILKKKNNKWLIVSGIVGIVRPDAPYQQNGSVE
ncbi:MAG: nuclear transport factor 2 family protein [Candidatus Kapabacteria bacterium]|nr:nuclear transport factor 2 family protein [Ignavibacteriota bacterium]MCW5884955.1 nuclear transport factor 2 family protein [Candidatus Kapabacteria bacterium]